MADKKGINKVSAGMLGVAVGVAAGAVSVILSDKKNREKALKKAKELQKQAEGTVGQLQEKAQTLLDKVEEVRDGFMGEIDEKAKKITKQEEKDE